MLNKDNFNKIANHPLQSWEWGEFRKAAGNIVVRFPFGQITVHKLPFTNYKIAAFIKSSEPTKGMLAELTGYCKENRIIFVKIEPAIALNTLNGKEKDKLVEILKGSGSVKGKTLFTPTSFWIDLTRSEDESLASFSSKTRYNIKLAQKHGVTVKEDNSEKAFARYLELTEETTKRQNFFAHTKKYHELMWKTLNIDMLEKGDKPIARLLTAAYEGEIVTTWILFVWKDVLYYPYGASTERYKNIMANNLMMWEAIKLGKKLGLTTFDLWGREEGKGFTKFKEGYNPEVVYFLGSWDLVINKPLYAIYRTLEIFRWFLLRLLAKSGLSKPSF